MEHFTKEKPNNEVMEFNAKFGHGKKSYVLKSDGINITEIKTDDSEIITWLKDHGF